ncbi:hypothetical protein BS50DRAFT_61107 [Corynespora cassiicola Philippines]|uniref:F-box domain-containing protein n=1 Tax=Corynespora cassiicola Philippines TaxID=1448308 RepID=A0A2T2NJC7_CORCC|nr:hypothetical protein BS50DRAFT_61107 [Corynespora cassiicola Philippines]
MAAAEAMANRHIVSTILHELSNMTYKDRRQYGPDQPVEFLEFRPTLVPSIRVNRLWADEGTSILWRRFPHLPALQEMAPARRQYYANKVHEVFSMGPPQGHPEAFDYLHGLHWPSLKSAELEVDWQKHGDSFSSMLQPALQQLEIGGQQSGGSSYFADVVLPSLFFPCKTLKTIHINPDTISDGDPLPSSVLLEYLDSMPTISAIEIKGTNFVAKDALFLRLSQRAGLESLEIDLEPGISVLSRLQGPDALPSPFASLKRLHIMCYPEIALSLPAHLHKIEDLHVEVARIPNQSVRESDFEILEGFTATLSHCPNLRTLKVGLALIAENFPSYASLPRLGGPALVRLAENCPKLEDLNLFSIEPSAIDGSSISSEHFDQFCQRLPRLRKLGLKLHPATTSVLQQTALQSLGKYCQDIEVLRLKIPILLPALTSDIVPQILVSDDATHSTVLPMPRTTPDDPVVSDSVAHSSRPSSSDSAYPPSPLFPNLTLLAIARPETMLAVSSDSFTVSSMSNSVSEIIDPEVEEDLVRSWARPLLLHFPKLEVLEAWGDWIGKDSDSLTYYLPSEEILATTWDFLSGVEQDLWDDDLEDEVSWEGSDDWDKASLMNEYIAPDVELGKLSVYDEEPEGTLTPGPVTTNRSFFPHSDELAEPELSPGLPMDQQFAPQMTAPTLGS